MDVGYKVALVLEDAFGARMKTAPVMGKICEKQWYGRKSGKGFYLHQGKRRKPNPELSGILPKGESRVPQTDHEIVSRCLTVMINEAAHCLEEEVCREPADVDLGLIMGIGFPPFRGGLLRYADSLGIDHIVAELKRFQDRVDPLRFKPANLLLEMKSNNRKFYRD